MANIRDTLEGAAPQAQNTIAHGAQAAPDIPAPATAPATPIQGVQRIDVTGMTAADAPRPSVPKTAPLTTPSGGTPEIGAELSRVVTEYRFNALDYELERQSLLEPDPEQYRLRWETAKALSQEYQMHPLDMLPDLDIYLQNYWGESGGAGLKTAPKAIADSFAAGTKAVELGWAGTAAFFDDSKLEDVRRIAQEMQQLQVDKIPRNWLISGFKQFGLMAPATGYFIGTSFLAGAISGGLGAAGAAAQGSRGLLLAARAIQGLDYIQSAQMMTGMAYADMTLKGVDPKAARMVAPFVGVINTAIERFIGAGLEGAYRRAGQVVAARVLGKEAVEEATKRIAGKFLAIGGLDAVGKNFLKEAVSTTFSEMGEEGLQALNDGIAMAIAESLSEQFDAPVLNKTTAATVFGDIAESIGTSLWFAPIIGVPANLIASFNSVKDVRKVTEIAKVTDKGTFLQIAGELPATQALPADQRTQILEQIYDGVQDKFIDDTTAKQVAKDVVPEGQVAPERTEVGDIRYTENITSEEGGKTRIEYTAGPLNKPHATIEFEIAGDELVITAADFQDQYRGTADELIQQIAAEYPSLELKLSDADLLDPTIVGAYERAVAQSPTGRPSWVAKGKTAEDAKAMQRLRSSLARTGRIGLAQQELTIQLADRMARGKGVSFAEFTKKLQGFEVDAALKAAGKAGALETLQDAAQEAQYIVKLAENANFAVVVHELGHFARKTLGDSKILQELESVYNVQDGQWTAELEEQFTNDLMRYIEKGEVKDESVRGVFQRIADFLSRTWNGILSKAEPSEEVVAWFDRYFGGELAAPDVVATQQMIAGPEIVALPDGVETPEYKAPDAEDASLFMTQEEIKRSSQSVNEAASQEAADYKTVEEWCASLGLKYEKLRIDQKRWMNGIFNRAHADKPVQFKPGEFAKMLSDSENIRSFLEEAEAAIYKTATSQAERTNQRGITDAIMRTPILKRLVDRIHAGETLMAHDVAEARRYIRANEPLVKFLYARVKTDSDLAFEAATALPQVAPLARKALLSRPGISLKEQEQILLDIRDKDIRQKIKDKTITVADLTAFIKAVKVPLRTEKDMKGAALRDYKAKVRERDAARRLRAAMLQRKRYIMQSVPLSVDIQEKEIIHFIQQYLRSNGGKVDGARITALTKYVFTKNPDYAKAFADLIKDISEKPFDTWSFSELDQLSALVKQLIDSGKARRAAQRLAYATARDRRIASILAGMEKKNPIYADRGEEFRKQQKKVNKDYDWMNIDRFARLTQLDESLLVDGMMEALHRKLSKVFERTNEVQRYIEKTPITVDGKTLKMSDALNRTVTIDGIMGARGEATTWTRKQLMGAALLVGGKKDGEYNQNQREAFVYGNLLSIQEKQAMDDAALIAFLSDRVQKIQDAVDKHLTTEERKAMKMMLDNLNQADAWLRFSDAVYQATGRDMRHETAYFPMVFANGVKSEDSILRVAASVFGEGVMDMGITYDRVSVKPINRRPLDFDAVTLFYDSVRHQEHITAFATHMKQVVDVFGANSSHSVGLRQQIEANNGTNALKHLDNYIDALGKAGDFSRKAAGSDKTSLLRGGVVVGALGFRLSAVLMQVGTSPLPFLQEVSTARILSSYGSFIGSGDPIAYIERIEALSPTLKYRQLDPLKEVERMQDTGFEGGVKRFGEKSMLGLYWADRVSVALGWEAVYKQKLDEYQGQDGAADKARAYADKVIMRTQPSSEGVWQAPAYRDMDFFRRMFLQFTRPQNVIWQNLRYDMPAAWSEGNYRKAISIAMAYALSGAVMGMVWAARGRGPEDDEDLLRYYAWAMTSQFSDSIPLAGEMVTQVTRAVFLGERYRPFSGQQLPVAESAADFLGVTLDLARDGWDDEKAMKAGKVAAKFTGYALGIPVAGPQEAIDMGKAIGALFSE